MRLLLLVRTAAASLLIACAGTNSSHEVLRSSGGASNGGATAGGANGADSDAGGSTSSLPEVPGLSPELHASPTVYACVRNFYVAANGSDSNPGTEAAPWQSIQHADASSPQAGDCINVQPGTYPNGWTISHGGDRAAPDGYVVYRCVTLGGCIVTSSSGSTVLPGTNYVVWDGFEFAANAKVQYGIGLQVATRGDTSFSSHHIWAINNTIHGFGQSGIQFNDGDYLNAIHNVAYDNSNVTCDAQGSGISFVVEKASEGYGPTAADAVYAPYHNLITYNVAHDNQLTQCGSAAARTNTDGNGIIIDTFDNQGSTNVPYPYQTLVSFNIAHGNGAKGVWVFRSAFVTVANNTAYNNNLDPFNNGTYRPEIGVGGGQQDTFINNIAWALPLPGGCDYSAGDAKCNSAFGGGDAAGEVDANNTWSNNVAQSTPAGLNEAFFNADSFSCSANRCAPTDPGLVNAPSGNFALTPGSPAIGYGLVQPYLPPAPLDTGACSSGWSRCPLPT
jgi:parallel beta-helix repeat protein